MTTPGILIVFSNQPYIGQIIFSNVFFIQDFQRPLVMNGMTGWKLNSKTYSEIYNLKSQNHIIGNASVRSNEVLLNLYYFGDEITKDQTIAILNEHIRPSTERQLYCFAETKNHIWDRIGFIIEPSGIIKHTSGTPRVSIIVNDSYLK